MYLKGIQTYSSFQHCSGAIYWSHKLTASLIFLLIYNASLQLLCGWKIRCRDLIKIIINVIQLVLSPSPPRDTERGDRAPTAQTPTSRQITFRQKTGEKLSERWTTRLRVVFIIRCCLFNHFIIHISWYTLPFLWIVVFLPCIILTSASCSKHDPSSCVDSSTASAPGPHGRGKLIVDCSNMLILFPAFTVFTERQRLDGVWSRLY